MRINDKILNSVVFIGIDGENATSEDKQWRGTGFLVSVGAAQAEADGVTRGFLYVVTAKHVIVEIGEQPFYIRANRLDGGHTTIRVNGDASKYYHPDETQSADVVVIPLIIPKQSVLELKYATISTGMFLTEAAIRVLDIGAGDEVLIPGLFAPHPGEAQNIPILRSGKIAALPKEPVKTDKFGKLSLYLIEAHSIGGLSGSPVFVAQAVKFGSWKLHFLGLVHGHYAYNAKQTNSGIAMVFPAEKIYETLLQPQLEDFRQRAIDAWKKKHS